MSDESLQTYTMTIRILPDHVDENGHANNVEYVKWMQEIAIRHADHVGCSAATREVGGSWYIRSHNIVYRTPAFLNDEIAVETRVGDLKTSRSTRTYRFVRNADGAIVATASTEWVFVDASTGRPRIIPPIMASLFGLDDTVPESVNNDR